jgi:hypothetical protein
MRKLVFALALGLSLSGCANLGPLATFATTGVSNPVTPDMVYRTEQTMIIAVSGLNAYKQACIAKTIAQTCRGHHRQVADLHSPGSSGHQRPENSRPRK